MTNKPSQLREAILETADGMHRAGIMSEETFRKICDTTPRPRSRVDAVLRPSPGVPRSSGQDTGQDAYSLHVGRTKAGSMIFLFRP